MRTWWLAPSVLFGLFGLFGPALAGCGEVIKDGPGDGRACAGNTPQACGPACVMCPVSGDRTVPTCDGTACGTACRDDAPKCSDNTCSQVLWTFESGMVDGITLRAPSGLALAVRNFNGAQALAVDVQDLSEISLRIPVCLSGVIDARQKTFSFQVFFQGGVSGGIQYYVQVSVPSPQNGAYLASHPGVESGMWTPFSAPLSGSQFSGTCSEITIRAGTLGAQFSGTIWLDDIKLE